jgi:hypothetical protein
MYTGAKFDIEAAILWERAEANADAAADFLLRAAEHLRNSKDVPTDIVEALAGAFEAAMVKPQPDRGKALLRELRLTAGNRRPVDVDWFQLGRRIDVLTNTGHNLHQAALILQDELDIDVSTVKRLWREKYTPFRLENEEPQQDHERPVRDL